MSCLVRSEAASWSLSGAGRDAGWHWASAVGASLHTGKWQGLWDADAHPCTDNTTTCCRVYTGSVQASALSTLSSSGRRTKTNKPSLCLKYTVNSVTHAVWYKDELAYVKNVCVAASLWAKITLPRVVICSQTCQGLCDFAKYTSETRPVFEHHVRTCHSEILCMSTLTSKDLICLNTRAKHTKPLSVSVVFTDDFISDMSK